ncbi:MAG: patatin-like phospholipase family protein [Bacteroidales bacterium]|nr:patatin-like phospholipase family protein [Bacteroidales bacterium]
MFRKNKKYKLGLVLSGGGSRGFAHIGALKALNEEGFYPDVISAVSAGSIVGAFYADGFAPDEIFRIFDDIRAKRFWEVVIPRLGLLKVTGLLRILKENLKAKNIEDLKIPLYVAATDLNNGKIVFFSKGEIIKTIIASSSIPILFQPVIIENITYVDGGVMNNLPVQPIENRCETIIGIHLNPTGYKTDFHGLRDIAERCFHLSIEKTVANISKNKCDIYIEPEDLGRYGLLDMKKGREIFEIGYNETKKALKEYKPKKRFFKFLPKNPE